jgi:parallel beta-helix repeat protein
MVKNRNELFLSIIMTMFLFFGTFTDIGAMTVLRTILPHETVFPGQPVSIYFEIIPDENSNEFGFEDTFPCEFQIEQLDNLELNGDCKVGLRLFNGSGSLNASYVIRVPDIIQTGTYKFDGTYFNEIIKDGIISGDNELSVREATGMIVTRSMNKNEFYPGEVAEISLTVSPGYATFAILDELVLTGWEIIDSGELLIRQVNGEKYLSALWLNAPAEITYQYKLRVPQTALGFYLVSGEFGDNSGSNKKTKGEISAMVKKLTGTLSYYVSNNGSDSSNNGTSPESPFATIQQAINIAVGSAAIYVADGIYKGPGNLNIDFSGKAVKVQSENGPDNCIIDCEGASHGFYFHNNEGANSILRGFTIKNCIGKSRDWLGSNVLSGGAILCEGSNPTIENNILHNNTSELGGGIACFDVQSVIIKNNRIISNNATMNHGGGVYFSNSNGIIENNIISENFSNSAGGGIALQNNSSPIIRQNKVESNRAYLGAAFYISNGRPEILNNLIVNNEASFMGGAFDLWGATIFAANNTIIGNSADTKGGAVNAAYLDDAIFVNNIFWGNVAPFGNNIYLAYNQSGVEYPANMTVKYSTLEGGQSSNYIENGCAITFQNILEGNPLLANSGIGKYNLLSGSPCIDAGTSEGTPGKDIEDNVRFDALNIPNTGAGPFSYYDIGAYEYHPAKGDINSDGDIDGSDLSYFLNKYLNGQQEADLNGDGSIDESDVKVFAENYGLNGL